MLVWAERLRHNIGEIFVGRDAGELDYVFRMKISTGAGDTRYNVFQCSFRVIDWYRSGILAGGLLMKPSEPRASRVTSEHATYSASVVDRATNRCFLDCQEIGLPYKWKT